jgi:hypothetical protein
MDLVRTGEGVDTEKDFCLERFISFARRVTDRLIADGHWADYIDPCSGLSMAEQGFTTNIRRGRRTRDTP